jgi:hypothetical protein
MVGDDEVERFGRMIFGHRLARLRRMP